MPHLSRPTSSLEPVAVTVSRPEYATRILEVGAGQQFLYLHGCGYDAEAELHALLPMPGIRLALPDQRGHGASTAMTDMDDYELSKLVADADAYLQALGWQAKEAIVGGASMGAAVALGHALTNPGRTKALVLCGPAFGPVCHTAAAEFEALGDTILNDGLETAVAQLKVSLLRGGMSDRAATGTVAPFLRQDPRSLAATMKTIFRWQPFSRFDDLTQLKVPVLIVGIEDDQVHPLDLAIAMRDHIPSSTLVTLPKRAEGQNPGELGGIIRSGLREMGILLPEGNSS